MKLLPPLAFILLQFQNILGMTIRNTLSNSRPHLGETITLSCNITGGTAKSLWWWKDKHGSQGAVVLSYNCLVFSKEYKSRLTNTRCDRNNFYSFQLSNVQTSDSGEWACEADGQEATTTLRLDVLVPPLSPTVTIQSPVNGGDTANLTCNAENVNVTKPVTYTWTKNGEPLLPETDAYGALLITPVTLGHAGKYVCVAKNDAGSKSSNAHDFVVIITLEWISEFNGESEQRFYVQYKQFSENWDVASEVPHGGITDPGLKKAVYHKVMGLESNVWYMFRVRIKNSIVGTQPSNFSNITSGKTAEKPRTTLMDVNRIDNMVTVRWKQVTGKYTALKIVYCQEGTEDCRNYTAPNPNNNIAAFFVDADKSYYYFVVVEDGGDVIYRSTVFKNGVNDKKNSQAVNLETNTSVFPLVGGVVVGGVIVPVAGTIAVFVLWKRALARWGTTQSLRPMNGTADKDDTRIRGNQLSTNDTADYDDTRIEFKTAGNSSVHANVNTGIEYENDAFHPKRPSDQNAALPMAIGHHNPVRAALGNEPTSSDDEVDVDAYDYVDSPSRRLQNDSGGNPAPEPQDHHTEHATPYEQFGQDVLSKKIIGQERQESEDNDSNLSFPIQGQPGQSTTESSSSQSDGDNKRPQSHSNDDMAHSQVSTYANLGRVEPVQHGEYLDLRHVQPCLE
ncbi:uncharacterized protein LOC135502424 isoform X2 [Lineus longissimus]|uniref:uncharacterized protein LOC135502424 isoform X2 n=1 Tax=Lineus longissimus TaxID=88925 RepID=UPI00315D3247